MHRRLFTALAAALLALAPLAPALAGPKAAMGADGLHIQPWFHASRGDLRSDLMAAAAAGKDLIVIWEQKGCSYCRRMHEVNFAKPEIVTLLRENFLVVQLDLRGADPVIDLDGAHFSEAALAERWGVTGTPTSIVLSGAAAGAGSLEAAQIFRLPGYLVPFQHYAVLDYFASGAYRRTNLKSHLATLAGEFAARGTDPATW